MLNREYFYIDKTEVLEKGIEGFPSIYIEGSAASGKTTAVRMLLEKHPDVKALVFNLAREATDLDKQLDELEKEMQKERVWVVFENLNRNFSESVFVTIRDFIRNMPEEWRVILVSREQPAEIFLDLFWKREMDIIPQETFRFTRKDIRQLIDREKSPLKAEEIYEQTDGWAGCVEVMIRLSKKLSGNAEVLRESYEVRAYIENEILATLSKEEQEILQYGAACPWINESLCKQICEMKQAGKILAVLERKGLLLQDRTENRWRLARLLREKKREDLAEILSSAKWEELGKWYEENGYLREAVGCFQNVENDLQYKECLKKHYDRIPFLNVKYDEVMNWNDDCLEINYLKGMYCYEKQDLEGLDREIEVLKQWKTEDKEKEHRRQEIYLNLMFVKPNVSLVEWMALIGDKQRFRLYSILGSGCTFLCGLRDLSGLFACAKKEENQKACFWKEHFGELEWIAYCLARMDYYMETRRDDAIKEEDWNVLDWVTSQKAEDKRLSISKQATWHMRLAGLYLLCKWCRIREDENLKEKAHQMEEWLLKVESESCVRNTEAIVSLYAPWSDEPDRLAKWLKHSESTEQEEIGENNYIEMYCRAKGYLLLNYPEKAERLLRKIIPYLQLYKRSRFYAESLFEEAIVNWDKNRRGQALKKSIESFLITGNSRYVGLYTQYGKTGYEVLKAYVDWLKNAAPEGWHRKKRYNYGNVLRMPTEDYMEIILRNAKRETKSYSEFSRQNTGEHLTMMETIILQDLSRGLKNAEICEEQNLKMSTVKSHIYSIYKKLGVNSRMQAVLKGKDLGIVK